jgi:hypothetical protein
VESLFTACHIKHKRTNSHYELKSDCPFCILAIVKVSAALKLETSRFDIKLSIKLEDWRLALLVESVAVERLAVTLLERVIVERLALLVERVAVDRLTTRTDARYNGNHST